MSDPSGPLIDLAAETALRPVDWLVIVAAGAAAVLYLGRAIRLRRRRLASGEVCGNCTGCGGACPRTAFAAPERARPG